MSITEPSGIGMSLNLAKLNCSAGNPSVPETPVLNIGTPVLLQEVNIKVVSTNKQMYILFILKNYHILSKNSITKLASSIGFEPMTLCLEGRCSIQLSYEDT